MFDIRSLLIVMVATNTVLTLLVLPALYMTLRHRDRITPKV